MNCDAYHTQLDYNNGLISVCFGTKEREECTCGGDTEKCNFYKFGYLPKTVNKAQNNMSYEEYMELLRLARKFFGIEENADE